MSFPLYQSGTSVLASSHSRRSGSLSEPFHLVIMDLQALNKLRFPVLIDHFSLPALFEISTDESNHQSTLFNYNLLTIFLQILLILFLTFVIFIKVPVDNCALSTACFFAVKMLLRESTTLLMTHSKPLEEVGSRLQNRIFRAKKTGKQNHCAIHHKFTSEDFCV